MNEINFNIENVDEINLSMDIATKEVFPSLENLEVTPTKERQVFNHEGSYGYDEVVVNAVSEEYIIPDGEIEITQNGSYDVKAYASAKVNIKPEGIPDVGFIIKEWDSSGNPLKIEILGMTSIPSGYMSLYGLSSSHNNTLKYITSIIFPDNLTRINDNCFYLMKNLETADLPDTITHIGSQSFRECAKLSLNKLPANLKTMSTNVFYGCTSITEIEIPSGVTSLQSSAGSFEKCTNLTKVDIKAENLTNVGSRLFAECTSLAQVIFRATKPPTLNSYSFYNSGIAKGTGYIYVPDASIDTYKSASVWSTYANQIKGISELPAEVI